MKRMMMCVAAVAMSVSLCALAQPFGGGEGGGEGGGRDGGGRGKRNRKGMAERQKQVWESVDREALFTALDTDGNGSVTKEEFAAVDLATVMQDAMRESMKKMHGDRKGMGGGLKNMDKNGDGKVTADEFPRKEVFDRILEKADTNGDGALAVEEIEAFEAQRKERKRNRGGDR